MLSRGAMNNQLFIAAAGAGKTTFLVRESLKVLDKKILITTFTEANANGIREKFIVEKGFLPSNITIMTWFSFLLQHCVRPYQGCYKEFSEIEIGFMLVSEKSGYRYKGSNSLVYWGEDNPKKFYLSSDNKIFSDKISKFVCEAIKRSENEVINRLRLIYDYIFIDEIQDMVGYDLDIIKIFMTYFERVILVGDPRQCTYSTCNTTKYKKYSEGRIEDFIRKEIGKKIKCDIDNTTLGFSHRNFGNQCIISSLLFPDYPCIKPCSCCRNVPDHVRLQGLYTVRKEKIDSYLSLTHAMQLRWNNTIEISPLFPAMNMGESKGLTFNHVLIYPTKQMMAWLIDHSKILSFEARAKFYVALTRSRFSLGIVCDHDDNIPLFLNFDN